MLKHRVCIIKLHNLPIGILVDLNFHMLTIVFYLIKVYIVTLPVGDDDILIRLYSLPDTIGRSKHNGFVSPGKVIPKDGT